MVSSPSLREGAVTRTASGSGGQERRCLMMPLLEEGPTTSAAARNALTPGRVSASPKEKPVVVGRAATEAEKLAVTCKKRAPPEGDSTPGRHGQTPDQNKLLKSQVCGSPPPQPPPGQPRHCVLHRGRIGWGGKITSRA